MAWVLASVFLMRVVARISLRVCGARASANVVGAAAAATSVRPVFIWALRVTVLAPCMAALTPALHCILSIPLAPCTRQPRQAAILPGDFVSPHTDLLSLCTHAHPVPPQDAPLRCRHRCTRQRLRLCACVLPDVLVFDSAVPQPDAPPKIYSANSRPRADAPLPPPQ